MPADSHAKQQGCLKVNILFFRGHCPRYACRYRFAAAESIRFRRPLPASTGMCAAGHTCAYNAFQNDVRPAKLHTVWAFTTQQMCF